MLIYYIPGTQMTLVFIGKSLLLEDSIPKTKDKEVPGLRAKGFEHVCLEDDPL